MGANNSLCDHQNMTIQRVVGAKHPDTAMVTSYEIEYVHMKCPCCLMDAYFQRTYTYSLIWGYVPTSWVHWKPEDFTEKEPLALK